MNLTYLVSYFYYFNIPNKKTHIFSKIYENFKLNLVNDSKNIEVLQRFYSLLSKSIIEKSNSSVPLIAIDNT